MSQDADDVESSKMARLSGPVLPFSSSPGIKLLALKVRFQMANGHILDCGHGSAYLSKQVGTRVNKRGSRKEREKSEQSTPAFLGDQCQVTSR